MIALAAPSENDPTISKLVHVLDQGWEQSLDWFRSRDPQFLAALLFVTEDKGGKDFMVWMRKEPHLVENIKSLVGLMLKELTYRSIIKTNEGETTEPECKGL